MSELRSEEASLFGEWLERPIFLLTWSRRCHAVSRCHDKQYKCHTLRWTNPVPILSGRVSIHWLQQRVSTETSWSAPHRVPEWAALSMLSVFSLAMIDQMPRFRINLSRVPSPDLGCFLSNFKTLSMACYPWGRCLACLGASLSQSRLLEIIVHLYLEH